MRIVATAGLRRVFDRAEAASTAMRARCFAWNPTPPTLRLGAVDVPALALAAALAVAALAPVARNLTGA
jgi:biotin transport system permease protein